MKFKCWEDGDFKEEGEEIEADSPSEAAKEYARQNWYEGDIGDSGDIVFVQQGEESPRKFLVRVEVTTNLAASEL